MRSLSLLVPFLIASPALAHPVHVGTEGGHSHWFELAVGGIAVLALAVWLVSKLRKNPVSDNG